MICFSFLFFFFFSSWARAESPVPGALARGAIRPAHMESVELIRDEILDPSRIVHCVALVRGLTWE